MEVRDEIRQINHFFAPLTFDCLSPPCVYSSTFSAILNKLSGRFQDHNNQILSYKTTYCCFTDLSDVVKGEAGLEEDEDDEAVVVSAVPNRRGHRSGGGKNSQKKFQGSRGGSGTPGSTRSSQDSASSTKRLLPKTLNQTVTVVPGMQNQACLLDIFLVVGCSGQKCFKNPL